MLAYIVRRLLLIIPTLLGIMILNFVIVQAAPGGPVEQAIAQITGIGGGAVERVAGGGGEIAFQGGGEAGTYRGDKGLDPKVIAELEQRLGFDKQMHERLLLRRGKYLPYDR